MDFKKLTVRILPDRMAVCRLDADAPLPDWIEHPGLYSITRTEEELTIVCDETLVASGMKSNKGWRCFKVEGPLEFSETGIIFSLAQPLARNAISIFVISTFDTDYLMVKEKDLAKANDVLTAAGHEVMTEDRGQKS